MVAATDEAPVPQLATMSLYAGEGNDGQRAPRLWRSGQKLPVENRATSVTTSSRLESHPDPVKLEERMLSMDEVCLIRLKVLAESSQRIH